MNNQEVQLILMNITLVLAAILVLLFILRAIRVLTKKRIESKEDVGVMLFLLGFICLFAHIKSKKHLKKKINTQLYNCVRLWTNKH